MEETEFKWMPHHEGAVPPAGQGKRISTYTVALEAWRRGLNLKFYSAFDEENRLKVRYEIGNEERNHRFSLSMGDAVAPEAFDICANKELTKEYLRKDSVPIPEGKMFDKEATDEEIFSFAETMRFPIVFKPTDGNAGKGVFANIQSIEELKDIIPYVRKELGFGEVIVENYIPGEEFRICVIEDRVLGAMIRRPASIIGDGQQTVKELIDEKNRIRKMNPHLTSRLIKQDREVTTMLERKGYAMNSVPVDGERVYLREKSNLAAGGDAIDVTNELTEELKQIAVDAGRAIPGLKHFGVDMIVDRENNTGVILEMNTRPGIGGHLFPMEGTPRDFAKEIIDYYFPETKETPRSWLYFDFDDILLPIKRRNAEHVQVARITPGQTYAKKYIVSGTVQKVGYRKWIKDQANNQGLHGYTKNLKDGTAVVVVAGVDQDIVDNFKSICYEGPTEAAVEHVDDQIWNKPVKIGFEIIKKAKKEAKTELVKVEKKNTVLEKERERLKYNYNRVVTSKSWMITYPLRVVLEKLKKN